MLSSADINALDLAHTHAQSAKKKGVLETVFINLYEKYKQGEVLDKVEERAIKDYLAVYRSEFALLKKQARMKNNADKIINKQTSAEKKLRAEYNQALIDLKKCKDDLAAISNELSQEKQSNRLLNEACIRYMFYNGLKYFDKITDIFTTSFMIAMGAITAQQGIDYFDSFGVETLNHQKCLRCSKEYDDKNINLVFAHFNKYIPSFGYAREFDIIAMVYMTENGYSIKNCLNDIVIVSLTSVDADIAKSLLDELLRITETPDIYSGIDYSDKICNQSSYQLEQEENSEAESYEVEIQKQFELIDPRFLYIRT